MLSQKELQQKLESTFGTQNFGIAVLVYLDGKCFDLTINNFSKSSLIRPGCIAKTLTSTLFSMAMTDYGLRLDHTLDHFCHERLYNPNSNSVLKKIQLGQLLNHTSGLDHSIIESIPKDHSGLIMKNELFSFLASSNNIPPGEVFCYSHAGYWLAAAILEHTTKTLYAELLRTELLKTLAITKPNNPRDAEFCPSIGGDLLLSAEALMKLALLHMYGDSSRPELINVLLSMRTLYPFKINSGATMKGYTAHPVWFNFGGSYGQSGHTENTSAAIRFIPDKDIAIVVTAEHPQLHNTVLAMLFSDLLPDFKRFSIPSLITDDIRESLITSPYEGTYQNSKYRLLIHTGSRGSLLGTTFLRKTENHTLSSFYTKRSYIPAQDHLFIPTEPEKTVCPTLQFSHPSFDGKFQYINTGNYLFSRAP